MVLALVGNQNSGKTTLFNQLTGSNQHVGNFPGVTVEQKSGIIQKNNRLTNLPEKESVTLVDLPGVYSLRPFSGEELVTREFLLKGEPDGIINILDASNLERGLYLTLQLMDLGIPLVLALNMMDEVRGNGGLIDDRVLSRVLDLPVTPISAAKGEGVEALVQTAVRTAAEQKVPSPPQLTGPVRRCLEKLSGTVAPYAQKQSMQPGFAAVKVLEDDGPVLSALKFKGAARRKAEEQVLLMEEETGQDRNAALAGARYRLIEEICAKAVEKPKENREHRRSLALDRWLTHKYLALPIFFGIMVFIFWLTFGVIGPVLSGLLESGIDFIAQWVDSRLAALEVNPVVCSLVMDGIFAGVGSVLSFLPIIVTLFLLLSFLEDSGYMARVAYVMDKPLRAVGLSGRSFVPMLIGFGCTVPAIMATRTLPSQRDRRLTIFLLPFMSCSAKLPIYAMFTAAFFPKRQVLAMLLLYLGGIGTGVLCGLLLKHTAFPGKSAPFVMELPHYRLPSLKSVALLMWDRARDFLTRAFTIIFLATVVIWFLQTFNYQFNMVEDSSLSLLATLGRSISPLFRPLGFDDWRSVTALLTGFTAKEAVVSTLAVLTGAGTSELPDVLAGMFTPLSAVSFLIFTLLYTPCVAAIAAVSREMKSALAALVVVVCQCGVAWALAALVYQAGNLLWC